VTSHTVEQLNHPKMTLKRLAEIGRGLGLKFTKNDNKADRREKILTEQARRAAANQSTPKTDPSVSTRPERAPSPKPGFARLIDSDTEDPPPEQRGGKRDGAGRPVGMDAERAKMTHLSDVPHPPVADGVRALFELWNDATGCEQVTLTDDEVKDLAMGPTHALEYSGLVRYVPAWVKIPICSAIVWYLTIKRKARLAREHRAKIEAEKGAATDGSDRTETPTP